MISKIITIQNPNGIHLRVAAQVVQSAHKHNAKVTFYKDGKEASAESILELLILEATQNSQIKIIAEGNDAQKVMNDIGLILTDGAGI